MTHLVCTNQNPFIIKNFKTQLFSYPVAKQNETKSKHFRTEQFYTIQNPKIR